MFLLLPALFPLGRQIIPITVVGLFHLFGGVTSRLPDELLIVGLKTDLEKVTAEYEEMLAGGVPQNEYLLVRFSNPPL